MIRTFIVELNAAHPELPLMEATAIVGSPSAANIVGVPAKIGEWTIDSVFIRISYPDASTITQEAVKSADGVWTATVPRCDVSGRVKCGFEILASGTDETGEPVSGYTLGIADFAVYTRDLEIHAGEQSVTLHYFAATPAAPATGDVAPFGGVLSLYDGYNWVPIDNRDYTPLANKPQINGVTLSGNLTAFELGLASLSNLPYPFGDPITTEGEYTLADRTVNIVTPETGNFIGLLQPDGISGKSRDYTVYIAPGADYEGIVALAIDPQYTFFGDNFGMSIEAGEKWLISFTEVYPNAFYVRSIKLEGSGV